MIRRDAATVPAGVARGADSVPPAPTRAADPSVTMRRLGRWVARKGWIHVLLLTAIAICLYPFIWMLMTSIKTDEELSEASMAPAIPSFQEESPYVRPEVKIERPEDAPIQAFAVALPALVDLTRSAVRANIPASAPPSIVRETW